MSATTPAGPADCGPPGMVYSRADMTWLTPEEAARRREARENRAARRRSHNGFPCPQIAPVFSEHTVGIGEGRRLIASRADMRDWCERMNVVPYEPYEPEKPTWAAEREEYERDIKDVMDMKVQMHSEQIEPLAPDTPDDAGVIDTSGALMVTGDGTGDPEAIRIVEPDAP